jgi:iron-sulfur cluster protein
LLFRRKQRKRAKKALNDKHLQKALEKASSRHFEKFDTTKDSVPWEDIKKQVQNIRQTCIKQLPELIYKFTVEAKKAGATVHAADKPEDALHIIQNILQRHEAKLIVKSKSMVSEEIALNHFLEKEGYKVVETDLGEWIVQLAEEKPSHITAPALHKTKEEIANLINKQFHTNVSSDPKEIVKIARSKLRKYFLDADVGISGANFAVAESGTLVIVSNEGNARLVTSLPPVHIALVTVEKFVDTLEQATTLTKALVLASSGLKLTAYVSFITGTSRTTDIEKELVMGVHGPKELHIIILDNGRLDVSEDENLNKILSCLKCGGCMLVCPVFSSLGGHIYGGPVYPGGIGLLLTALTHRSNKNSQLLDLCADCKKCEEFCPVGIPVGDLLLLLKGKTRSKIWERALSFLFRKKPRTDKGLKFLSLLQKPWQKNGFLNNLPVPGTKGKSFPAFKPKKFHPSSGNKGSKIYLFEGCLGRLFFPEIREAVIASLSPLGFHVVSPASQVCCGAPSLHLGQEKDVKKLAVKNLQSFAREAPEHILTICPTGYSMLKKTYPKIVPESTEWTSRVFDFTEFIVKKGYLPEKKSDEPIANIFYHYPCHYLSELKLKEEPIKLLESLGFRPVLEEEPFSCCGFCGVFSLKNPELSAHFWQKKNQKIKKSKTSLIATDCPGCLFQLKSCLAGDETAYNIFHPAVLFDQQTKKDRPPSKSQHMIIRK